MTMPDILREFEVHEFKGQFPNVPLAPEVNLEELKETDDDPMFVTLPIIPEIGAVSKSGLLYDEALANSIEEQIKADKTGGQYGHLENDKRSTEYRKAEALWVGAMRQGNTLWGKAYVPPGAARDDIRRKKAVGGKIATSIYGPAKYENVKPGVRRAAQFNLESVDFAPPERAALNYGVVPHITAEMNDETEGDDDMPTKEEIIAELSANDVPATLRQQIVQEWQEDNEDAERISELEQDLEDRDTVISELRDQLETTRVREFENAVDNVVAEYVTLEAEEDEGKKKVQSLQRMFRSRVIAELGDERDVEQVAETAEELWDEEFQVIAETVRDALAGPAARVNGKRRGNNKLEDTPESRAKARSWVGV